MHDAILTLSVAVAAGAGLVILGSRLRIPYIVLLLFGGVLSGPEVLGIVQPVSLHQGLEVLVALAVAVILFEGGLTLDLGGYRRSPIVIRRLLTVGALITWLGTGASAHLLFGLSAGMSLMVGSLVIVTGPTVISPLLRRLNIDQRLLCLAQLDH
ncbi:MAG: cation:proton antiporter [Myxococcales bacterium]|nr:cation:proton antiporter [Myxococcales bacterium]